MGQKRGGRQQREEQAAAANPGREPGVAFQLGLRWNKPYPYLRLPSALWHR